MSSGRLSLLAWVAALPVLPACSSGPQGSSFANLTAADASSPSPPVSQIDAGGDSEAPTQTPLPQPPTPAAVCSAPTGTTTAASALVAADTSFAVALYGPALTAVGTSPNAVMSPYSVSATLTMLDVGAAGATDAQIQAALDLPAGGAALAPAYAGVACQDETDAAWMGNQLSIANALWGQQGTSFEPSFLSVLASGYDAPLQSVDFAGDPSAAEGTIDAWVSQQTAGAIPSLLQAGDLDAQTRVVLVNAVYFKGTWANGFDPALTKDAPFTLADGTQVEVPTMTGTVSYALGDLKEPPVSVYELDYVGDRIAMDLLVPGGSLASFEASLTPAVLMSATANLYDQGSGQISLPKFSFGTRLALTPVLESLGMTDAFQAGVANLSGIDGEQDLFVQTVVEQALVEVDESGTVAAAATGASGGGALLAGPGPVAIDGPFVFLVRDTKNGSILFMGHVLDPRAN